MKKGKSVIALLALFLTFSFVPKDVLPGIGLSPGSRAPEIRLEDDGLGSFRLSDEKGKYVLISFWAAYDAPSRISNLTLDRAVARIGNPDLKYVSISYDTRPAVFLETVRTDELDRSGQFYDKKGKDSEIFKTFRLKKGFTNYLIDPHGVIIAKNITPESLAAQIGR